MSNIYIYNYDHFDTSSTDKFRRYSFLFIAEETPDHTTIKEEVKNFYRHNYYPNRLFVVGAKYAAVVLKRFFVDDIHSTLEYVPDDAREIFINDISVVLFDELGELHPLVASDKLDGDLLKKALNHGMSKIFHDRGGLIEAQASHHFIFPSGKHCDKFLRTGNILLEGGEIFFIAFQALKYYHDDVATIYCDTSSINPLAFALVTLRQRFRSDMKFPKIHSFSSYQTFENEEWPDASRSLVLISSSTSANIIDRLLERERGLKADRLCIFYYLGSDERYALHAKAIICDLKKSRSNPFGVVPYNTYSIDKCNLCRTGSYPVKVSGDVFLLEKPSVRLVKIDAKSPPRAIRFVMDNFMSRQIVNSNIVRVHFKESSAVDQRYDLFINAQEVLRKVQDNDSTIRYVKFRDRLKKYFSMYLPANAAAIVTLPDKGSQILAKLMQEYFQAHCNRRVEIVEIDNIAGIRDEKAAVVIASSILARGRRLLYISQAFRDKENLSLIYFTCIARTETLQQFDFIKGNLTYGHDKSNSHVFVCLEQIFIPGNYSGTVWQEEINVLKRALSELDDMSSNDEVNWCVRFLRQRLNHLESPEIDNPGLANGLFYPALLGDSEMPLGLRKNFAFATSNEYYGQISQADVYFIISVLLHNLRHSSDLKQNLQQTEFVRSLIDPINFQRYNDGLLQAALLRAAKSRELSFDLDLDASARMRDILINIIEHSHTEIGEAFLEFMYALSINKLRLVEADKNAIYSRFKSMNVPSEIALLVEVIREVGAVDYSLRKERIGTGLRSEIGNDKRN